ncbi:rRNA 2'-O-methyltransferase fibrillarin-like [Leopardus geoffroyi]|uniref:rRNA 2'-O-methyltransferase fibrillarin-like n=1 Tax=Leopardus geoffroyi TaxID=46844 RepID=UPI001E262109|nr:rRNA 2'-O-methyltransferase fibrillarin-like [Leopardus geoffroyi]
MVPSVRPDPGPAPDTPGGGKRGTGGGRGAGVGRTSSGGGARGLRLGAANRARPGPSAAGAPGAHWLARRGAGESAPLWALGVARGVSWPPVGARQRGLRQPCGGPGISTGIYCSADRSPSASALKPTPSSELSEAGEVLVQRIAHQVEEGAGRSFSGRRVLLCLLTSSLNLPPGASGDTMRTLSDIVGSPSRLLEQSCERRISFSREAFLRISRKSRPNVTQLTEWSSFKYSFVSNLERRAIASVNECHVEQRVAECLLCPGVDGQSK